MALSGVPSYRPCASLCQGSAGLGTSTVPANTESLVHTRGALSAPRTVHAVSCASPAEVTDPNRQSLADSGGAVVGCDAASTMTWVSTMTLRIAQRTRRIPPVLT